MNRYVCIAAAILLRFSAAGQITQEQVYNDINGSFSGSLLTLTNIGSVGPKYLYWNQAARTIKLYNLNHSLYHSATINMNPTGGGPGPNANLIIRNVSSDVFDCDSTSIEVAMEYTDNQRPGYTYFEIQRTNGAVIFHLDSFQILSTQSFANPFGTFLMNTPSGTKMLLWSLAKKQTIVYSVCGKAPVNMIRQGMGEDDYFNVSPNPAKELVRVDYHLPEDVETGELVITDQSGRQVKVFHVDNSFGHLMLSNADLPPGTYYYQLRVPGSAIQATRKIIQIH